MRKAKITAAIITKNEEKNIKECIEYIKDWADEIIVIDGYSQDKTVPIAQELGAKVIKHRFEGDFSKERNIGMENAQGDWVLHLDADDRVTQEFKESVDRIIDADESVDVYKFKRKNFFLGRPMMHGGWYHYIPNLVRRNKVKFEGALHERPIYAGKTGVIEADIEHYPFDSISRFVDRHNRYSSVEAEKMYGNAAAGRAHEVRKNMVRRTFKIFWKMYVKKKGYKEGFHGLIFAILFASSNFLIWAKYWELCNKDQKDEQKNVRNSKFEI